MRIAVNTRFLLHKRLEGIGTFSYEVLKRLVANHPQHEFIFLFDRPWHPEFVFAPNVEPHRIWPPARHPILFVWWFECAIAAALKKTKAQLFFSPDGYLSLGAKVPQIPVFHDLAFEHFPNDVPYWAAKHYRYFFPRYAQKAARILTVSQFSKNDIEQLYSIDHQNISVVYNGANEMYKPLNEKAKQQIENKYSGGKPYFLYVGALHQRKNISRLLRAYKQYVDEQKSTERPFHNLLIVGRKAWGTKEMETVYEQSEVLQQYVKFTGRLDTKDLALVMASAFFHVNVSYFEGFGIPILESMQCGVPAITSQNTAMEEIAQNAAIFVNPFGIESIKMALIMTTENLVLRNELAKNCLEQAAKFSWDKTASLVWNNIESVALENKI